MTSGRLPTLPLIYGSLRICSGWAVSCFRTFVLTGLVISMSGFSSSATSYTRVSSTGMTTKYKNTHIIGTAKVLSQDILWTALFSNRLGGDGRTGCKSIIIGKSTNCSNLFRHLRLDFRGTMSLPVTLKASCLRKYPSESSIDLEGRTCRRTSSQPCHH